ncbi:MAG: NAD(P)H-dependent oxidoreductase [Propionibacteriaceae bacterium]|jgi:NAD(P)H dehydrogenase (quinone)|nr:NAD(P)H-dependent oxidoreductase [Propionibacteriaceae bacterium]
MHVHIVYAHPSPASFTHAILTAFVAGLDEAGHSHTISDLYAMGFNPILSPEEYARESTYAADQPVSDDVSAEHSR